MKKSFLDIKQDKFVPDKIDSYEHKFQKGLSEEVVRKISEIKSEPQWMLDYRLKALAQFMEMATPQWVPRVNEVDFDSITYYLSTSEKQATKWEDVPENIKKTFERLGIPEAERKFLAGAGAQYESNMIYHKLREDLEKKGVIFCDMNTAVKEHPEIVKKYFGTVVPFNDNKFAALNWAVWSGGSFVYVPKGVKVDLPLQAYFRINERNVGQFERTLIIAEEGAEVHYIEGCSAPSYSSNSLHTAVVEIIAKANSRVRYTTLQNWATNVFNYVTKRAYAYENAYVEWVDANVGCLAKGTPIFTNPSIKNIEDINVGDKVITFNESTKMIETKKVLGTKFSGIKPVYSISLGNGKREIDATQNHPFLAVRYFPDRACKLTRYELHWKNLEELKVGDFVLVAKELPDLGKSYELPTIETIRKIKGRNQYGAIYDIDTTYKYNKIKIPSVTNEDIMWLFGLIVGDGNIVIEKSKNRNNRYGRIVFSIPRKDNAREKLLKIMKDIFILDKYYERKDGVSITYNSLPLAETFEKAGFKGNAHTKRIPEWIYGLPISQKRSFLAGYLEADGRINKNSARLKCCNNQLMEDFQKLCIISGIESNRIKEEIEIKKIKMNKNAEEKEYRSYVMHISELFKLREFFSEKTRTKVPIKKENIFKEWHFTRGRRMKLPSHLALLKITKIEKKAEVPTYDIEVEGSHNFVANGIFVHNSYATAKYPSVYLLGRGAKADILSVAFAGKGQIQDAGAKALHFAPNTSSTILSKSVSKDGGKTVFRGLVQVFKGAKNTKSHMKCDALLLDKDSTSDTIPSLKIDEDEVQVGHEAVVGKVGEEQLFYLMSRGFTQEEAVTMIVSGFLQPFTKKLPLEYAIEFNRLIELEMENKAG